MVAASLPSKTATVADLTPHRGSGRRLQIAHQFQGAPFWVALPSTVRPSMGKIAMQAWLDRVYPKHIIIDVA